MRFRLRPAMLVDLQRRERTEQEREAMIGEITRPILDSHACGRPQRARPLAVHSAGSRDVSQALQVPMPSGTAGWRVPEACGLRSRHGFHVVSDAPADALDRNRQSDLRQRFGGVAAGAQDR